MSTPLPTPTLAQKLMFDPLSYIHAERFSLENKAISLKQRAVINEMLLSSYQLTIDKPLLVPGSLAATLAKQWVDLPKVAFLLGCQRLRAELVMSGALFKLPAWARHFAEMPVRESAAGNLAASGKIAISDAYLSAQGLAEILSWQTSLPSWLWQRLPLLFSQKSDTFLREGAVRAPRLNAPDITLFILAGQYAKNYSDTTAISGA